LFSLFLGFVVVGMLFAWLLIHRFRLVWLEEQIDDQGLDAAIAERRAEGAAESSVPGAPTLSSPTSSSGESAP